MTEAAYLGTIHEENGVFGVSFPDFPGCATTASDMPTLAAHAALSTRTSRWTRAISSAKADGFPSRTWWTRALISSLSMRLPDW